MCLEANRSLIIYPWRIISGIPGNGKFVIGGQTLGGKDYGSPVAPACKRGGGNQAEVQSFISPGNVVMGNVFIPKRLGR